MTIEERFQRIEHVTAGLAEQWRREHEEDRQLWRDTQRQIEQFAAESRASDERLKQRIEQLAEESRAEDERLGKRIEEVNRTLKDRIEEVDRSLKERIESLVSAMGEFIASQKRERPS